MLSYAPAPVELNASSREQSCSNVRGAFDNFLSEKDMQLISGLEEYMGTDVAYFALVRQKASPPGEGLAFRRLSAAAAGAPMQSCSSVCGTPAPASLLSQGLTTRRER